jgi:hypothetical protein
MYIAILCRLTVVVRRKKLEKYKTNSWFPHHDNVPAHRSLLVQDFLAKYNVTAQEHSLYTSDLFPADFYLFSGPKSALKGLRFCGHYEECYGGAEKVFTKWLS